MKTNLMFLTKINSTAQAILNMFQLQPRLLQSDDAQLLNKHAYHISVNHNPFAVLKGVTDTGSTIWEDGVDSTLEIDDVH